jgi:hypothetical protein
MADPQLPSQSLVRALLVLIAVLLGVIVGLVAGILTVAGGGGIAVAVATGGASFAASVPLVLTIERALGLAF